MLFLYMFEYDNTIERFIQVIQYILLTIIRPCRSHAKLFECSVVNFTGSAKVVDKVVVE